MDPERVKEIITRSLQDADWIMDKYKDYKKRWHTYIFWSIIYLFYYVFELSTQILHIAIEYMLKTSDLVYSFHWIYIQNSNFFF